MKFKKTIWAVLMLFTISAGLTAVGCDNHTHAYRYTITTPATCQSQGERVGECGICGKKVTEKIPVDPDAHLYGEWDIKAPTESAAGSATKTCSADGYKLTVTLPKIDEEGNGYTSFRELKPATALSEGQTEYVLDNAAGEISFIYTVPAKGVETVANAIEATQEAHLNVRDGSGDFSSITYDENNMIAQDHSGNTFFYEFGENYTHSNDIYNHEERWYSLDENGEPWGILLNVDGELEKEALEERLAGANIALLGMQLRYVGAEVLLRELYALAELDTYHDFTQSVKDGVYSFGFGYLARNYFETQTFAKVEVQFTLSEDYTLQTLDVVSNAYINSVLEYDDDGNVIRSIRTWTYNDDGSVMILNRTGNRIVDEVHLTQRTVAEANQAGDAVPTNPYKKQDVLVSSFHITYGNQTVSDEPITVKADTLLDFKVTDLQPATAKLSLDPISVWLVKDDGSEVVLGYNSSTDATKRVSASYSEASGTVQVRSLLTGEVVLKVVTEQVAKEIKLNVEKTAPSQILPCLYEYTNHYAASPSSTNTATAKVYIGQPLYFKAVPPSGEESYVELGYTASVTSGSVTSEVKDGQINGVDVSVFTATATGTYTIRLTSDVGNKTATITVTVEEIPDMAQLLTGEYTAISQYPRGTVTVVFSSNNTVTITHSSGAVETLSFTYTLTTVTSSHVSGDSTLGFTLSLDEAYSLVLTHPTGYGDEVETLVLTRA